MSEPFGPILEAARIQSEINRLFDHLLDLGSPGSTTGAWVPTADISETPELLQVTVELPGVDPANLKLSAHGGQLIIEGEKSAARSAEGTRYHAAERAFGRFRRVIPLGIPVNTHRAEARLVDGCLAVRFPKVPNRRGEAVQIEVQSA